MNEQLIRACNNATFGRDPEPVFAFGGRCHLDCTAWEIARQDVLTDEFAGRLAEDMKAAWNRQRQTAAAHREQWIEQHPGGAR